MQMMVYYFFDEDFGHVTFCCDEMGILSVNLNNVYFDLAHIQLQCRTYKMDSGILENYV